MYLIYMAIFMLIFAAANCARGRKLFELTSSTEVGRVVATAIMGLCVTAFAPGVWQMDIILGVFAWVALLAWCSPAWDAYWSAELGNDPAHSKLWGLGMMTLRMSLAMPCLAGILLLTHHHDKIFYTFGWLTLGLPYYIIGFIPGRHYTIAASECVVGALLGFFIYTILLG